MKTTLHKANTRGHANHGWLDTYHTFSFANYYNPERVHFGNLRVLNDDVIAPGKGFGKHPHDNMEIVTIPLKGKLMHEDSMGHKQVIGTNEVQVMSAGTGIFHSEFNASETDPVNIIQLWIFTQQKNIKPDYGQIEFDDASAVNNWQVLVHNQNGPLKISQHASISRIFLGEGKEIGYDLREDSYGSYLFLVEGEVEAANQKLNSRDGLGIEQTDKFTIKANKDSFLINIEV
jgi:quercetin 2,3-dioxygenase